MIASIDDQIKIMEKLYPQFEVKFSTDWLVLWEGWLCPFMAKKYKIRVTMCLPKFLKDVEIKPYAPRVEILTPEIDPRTPHLYKNEIHTNLPLLCLYYPENFEWFYDDYIADTTIPWSIRWLASYEGWRATGKWTGGGKDHEPIINEDKKCKKIVKKDRQEHFNRNVFNSLGQQIGTYASFPLMVAASREFFQPLSWHDLSINSLMENLLETTSTTSAERQLAA